MNPNLSTASVRIPIARLRAEDGAAPLPSRFRIFKFGVNTTTQGDFIVDDTTIRNLAAFQRQIGREQVPIGFEHNIDEGSDEYNRTTEPRPVAASAATVEVGPDNSIFLSSIKWTPTGAATLGNYEDISPTPVFDKDTRRVIGIMSASLTRAGSMYGLTVASAQLSAALKTGSFEDRVCAAIRQAVSARSPQDAPLTGMARVIAANEREMARNPAHTAVRTLSAASRDLTTELKGMERIIAANQRDNAARQPRRN